VSGLDPSSLTIHAAWTLLIAQTGSLGYEVWRATARAGVSRFDSPRALAELAPVYLVAAGVIAALFADLPAAAPIGLVFSVLVVGVSTFYYNPVMMLARRPALVDWVEDVAYTAAHAVAATQLAYAVTAG
jgi:hypothetical protein